MANVLTCTQLLVHRKDRVVTNPHSTATLYYYHVHVGGIVYSCTNICLQHANILVLYMVVMQSCQVHVTLPMLI